MRRTQLYLDEEMARTLAALGRQRGKTVSQLVRESIQRTYMTRRDIDKAAIARQLAGLWSERDDLRDIARTVRRLRKGSQRRRRTRG